MNKNRSPISAHSYTSKKKWPFISRQIAQYGDFIEVVRVNLSDLPE